MYSKRKLSLLSVASMAATLMTSLILGFVGSTPASAFVGTLENGNMAYAQSSFNTGEACNYLPGITSANYDAWHFVLTTRGAVFQQSPSDPTVAINLNFVFMRQDGSLFVLKSGAWVQSGKGAYVYTLTNDRIRMVQTGSVANINVVDSGMRLSHTCPGTGSGNAVASPSPTPTATSSPSPSPVATSASPTPTSTATRTSSPSPTANTSSPSPTASPSPSTSPSPSVSLTPSPTPTATPSATSSPRPSTRASAIQPHSTRSPSPSGSPFPRNPLPTPTTSIQPINTPTPTPNATRSSTPTPSASATRTPSPTPSPTTTNTLAPTNSPEPSTSPNLEPPVLPTPPPVEDPKEVIYVDPTTPTLIPPQEFPKAPDTPIEIVTPPKYGDINISQTGEVSYTSNLTDLKSTVVDVVEFKYTNLAGETVVIRKEFVLTQKGDVPSIIQTGGDISRNSNLSYLLVMAFAFAIILIRKGWVNKK